MVVVDRKPKSGRSGLPSRTYGVTNRTGPARQAGPTNFAVSLYETLARAGMSLLATGVPMPVTRS